MEKASKKVANKPSRYDELFDKYQGIMAAKSGTKYEMLTALIFKVLNEKEIVIHDLDLIGETETPAQIDVCVEVNGARKRALIECKDFDVSNKNVGLPILRHFWAVVEERKPAEGIVMTCKGFSKNAKKYAKAKGIKLAVLREFREEDKGDRILSINWDISIGSLANLHPNLIFFKKEDLEKWQADLAIEGIENAAGSDKVLIKTPNGHSILHRFLDEVLNGYPRETSGHVRHKIPIDRATIEIGGRGEIPIAELTIDFDILYTNFSCETVSDKVAALILEPLEEKDDIVFFGEDIERYEIDPNSGEVKMSKKTDYVGIPGWNGPNKADSAITWENNIGKIYLKIAHLKDEVAEEYTIRGLIVPMPPLQQWLIKNGRRYEWGASGPKDWAQILSGKFVDTDKGSGVAIDEDVSTPEKMAAYLEKTAKNLTQSKRDLILWMLASNDGKMVRSKLRMAMGLDYPILDPILVELVKESKIKMISGDMILLM